MVAYELYWRDPVKGYQLIGAYHQKGEGTLTLRG